ADCWRPRKRAGWSWSMSPPAGCCGPRPALASQPCPRGAPPTSPSPPPAPSWHRGGPPGPAAPCSCGPGPGAGGARGCPSTDRGRYLDDLWAFDPSTERWNRLDGDAPRPGPRARMAVAWDGIRSRLLIAGGFAGGVDYLRDLWIYDAATGAWTADPASGPNPS